MTDFFYGVIEGFYGRQWGWQARTDYASFLSEQGFDCYIYAPKGDQFLRSRWRENHPSKVNSELLTLAAAYRDAGVRFGVGLSPLGLNRQYSADDRQLLKDKVYALNTWNADILCILFDDDRADIEGLAKRQAAIVNDIVEWSNARQFIVCPSYYSFDPVLEEVFGKMPEQYLENFSAALPKEIGVFWTGNKVISANYEKTDIDRIASILEKKPILWDNYPVNDGRLTSQFLHLRPYQGRPWQLQQWANGHIVNPMNQPSLSKVVLNSLAVLYRDKGRYNQVKALTDSFNGIGNKSLAKCLVGDVTVFQDRGLEHLSDADKQGLAEKYTVFDHPVAIEICEWLAGDYQFDPDCLTE